MHEVNLGDIGVDVEEPSSVAHDNTEKNNGLSSNKEDSLNTFLKKFDGEMKTSIQKAKKQR